MTVVVDASVALKWVLPQEQTDEALALWDRWQGAAELVAAPALFRAEVTNVIRQYVRRGHITPVDASEALDSLVSIVAILEPEGLYSRALAISNEHDLGAAYDAQYLALAELEGCEFWTADRKFVNAVGESFRRLRWIGELPYP